MKRDYSLAAARALETIAQWCPGYLFGQVHGDERKIKSPLREDKSIGSFSINEVTGEWNDFASPGDAGHDALSLYARIKGLKNGEAYAEIMHVEYDPADDFAVDPEVAAKNYASLIDEELKEEYAKVIEPKKNLFPLTRYGDMPIEPPKWLVKGILEDNSLGVVFGASGHGKSFFVLDLAACIATGEAFHKRVVKNRGAVVYIAGEGRAGISKRLKAWEIHNKADLSKAPLYISHKAAALCDDAFMEHVRKSVQAVGARERVALIVVDTWARNMAGDENSTVDTTAAIRAVDDLRALYQCTAIIVHHSGQAESERGRGSSALRAALDVEYKVEIQKDIMLVKNTKTKDGDPPDPMTFAFKTIDIGILDDDGEPVESSVLEEVELDGLVPRKKKRGKVQSAILEALEKSAGSMERQALKALLPDVKDSSFYDAITSLEASKDIIIEGCMILCTTE